MRPDEPDNLITSAVRDVQSGRLESAAASCRRVLDAFPRHGQALHVLGLVRHRGGLYAEAADLFRQAIAATTPPRPEFYNNLGEALSALGDFAPAEEAYRNAINIHPRYPQAYNGLANALSGLKRFDEALAAARKAIELNPHYFKAYNNLATVLNAMGRPDEAVAPLRKALEIKPDYVTAMVNLGKLMVEEGRMEEATELFSAAIRHDPGAAAAYGPLAAAQHAAGKVERAIPLFEKAAALNPGDPASAAKLAEVLLEHSREAEAMKLADIAGAGSVASRTPAADAQRVGLATLLPPIYDSVDEIMSWRRRLADGIADLHAAGVKVNLERHPARPLFYLPYHGLNDRDLMRQAALLYEAPQPPPRPRGAAAREKIRVGFISPNLGQHTIGQLNAGTIDHLSREAFEVVVFSMGTPKPGPVLDRIRARAERYVQVPNNILRARRTLLDAELDVAFYTDIGMDDLTYSLAFTRSAPVQCTTWGHPDTTGIPAMDYFISSDLLERPDAQEHYNERLVRLRNLAVCYQRPPMPPEPARTRFGFGEDANVYGIPQTLFKFHPDFDSILAAILERDPRAVIVLLDVPQRPSWREKLTRRLARVADVSRLHFLRPLPREDFLALNAVCNVLLDPLHFGGGNTSYEALAVGTPIVTLPSPFLRGRITLAQYTMMRLFDCIARDVPHYLELAVQLGSDRAARDEMSRKVLEACPVLFDNVAGIRELEAFFMDAVQAARNSGDT